MPKGRKKKLVEEPEDGTEGAQRLHAAVRAGKTLVEAIRDTSEITDPDVASYLLVYGEGKAAGGKTARSGSCLPDGGLAGEHPVFSDAKKALGRA